MFMIVLRFVPLRRELGIVLGVLFLLVALPIVAVTTILDNGIGAVSSSLVSENPTMHTVTLYSAYGTIRAVLQASTIWPVQGTVTQEFGADDSPYQAHHTGIDIGVRVGTPIVSFMGGTVTKTGYSISEGNFIYVDHGNNVASHYLHLSQILVQAGKPVSAGLPIGLSGNTGWSTGPHLHFEVRISNIPVNPRDFEVGNP